MRPYVPPSWLEEARALRECEGLSWRELSARMGISASTLQYHLQAGRRERETLRARGNHWADRERNLARARARYQALSAPPLKVTGSCSSCGHPMQAQRDGEGLCLGCRHRARLDRLVVVVERWLQDVPGAEIAAELGVSAARVYRDVHELRRAGFPLPRRGTAGAPERPPPAELRAELLRRWHDGEPHAQIAGALDLTPAQLRGLVQRLRNRGDELPYRLPRRRAPRAPDGVADAVGRGAKIDRSQPRT